MEVYIAVGVAVMEALTVGEVMSQDVRRVVEAEWSRDTHGKARLEYTEFCELFFELIDIWTLGCTPAECGDFLSMLLEGCLIATQVELPSRRRSGSSKASVRTALEPVFESGTGVKPPGKDLVDIKPVDEKDVADMNVVETSVLNSTPERHHIVGDWDKDTLDFDDSPLLSHACHSPHGSPMAYLDRMETPDINTAMTPLPIANKLPEPPPPLQLAGSSVVVGNFRMSPIIGDSVGDGVGVGNVGMSPMYTPATTSPYWDHQNNIHLSSVDRGKLVASFAMVRTVLECPRDLMKQGGREMLQGAAELNNDTLAHSKVRREQGVASMAKDIMMLSDRDGAGMKLTPQEALKALHGTKHQHFAEWLVTAQEKRIIKILDHNNGLTEMDMRTAMGAFLSSDPQQWGGPEPEELPIHLQNGAVVVSALITLCGYRGSNKEAADDAQHKMPRRFSKKTEPGSRWIPRWQRMAEATQGFSNTMVMRNSTPVPYLKQFSYVAPGAGPVTRGAPVYSPITPAGFNLGWNAPSKRIVQGEGVNTMPTLR